MTDRPWVANNFPSSSLSRIMTPGASPIKRCKTMELPDLPNEIIFSGILTRLPGKSLCRFKCVNKLWNATISDPAFVKSHTLTKSISSPILALYRYIHEDPRFCYYDFVLKDRPNYFLFKTDVTTELIGHCNGLFCFQSEQHTRVLLVNPCTRRRSRSRPIPPPPPSPSDPYIAYGFGFDPSANQYKAVQIVYANNQLYRCMVYTFGAKTNSWRDIVIPLELSLEFKWKCLFQDRGTGKTVNKGRALYVNATLFWFFPRPHLFIAFDLHSEEFRLFEGPTPEPRCLRACFKNANYCCFLMDWQGSMCLACEHLLGNIVCLYIYNSDGPDADGWHMKLVKRQQNLTTKLGFMVFLTHGALDGDSILYLFIGEELVLYTEGFDGRFYSLAGSELATKFPLPPNVPLDLVFEYQFTYHVENHLSLKTM